MFKITMDDTGVARVLQRGEAAARDLSPALRDIGGELLAISDQAFAGQHDPSTRAAWPELSLATIRERERLGFGGTGPILQRTRILRQSVQTDSDRNQASIGASVEYGLIHHKGGSAGRGGKTKIPARPFVGAHPDDLREFEDIIAGFLREAMS